MYGRDGLEDAFGENERTISITLGALTRDHLSTLSDADIRDVLLFVYYQRCRTRSAADQYVEHKEAVFKELLTLTGKAKGIDLSRVTLEWGGAVAFSMINAAIESPLIYDLATKFILAPEKTAFVMSDHPVVFYNQFAEHTPRLRDLPGATGLVAKGLQMYFPVSPSVTIASYDASTYDYGTNARICDAAEDDVALLNRMQILNARDCIYFRADAACDSELQILAEFRRRNAIPRGPQIWTARPFRDGEGNVRQPLGFFQRELRLKRRLSFVRMIETFDYSRYVAGIVPFRSFEAIEAMGKLKRHVKAKLRERIRSQRIEVHRHWQAWLDEDD